MNKKYWLYIDSFIHIAQKKNNVLLYHPYTGKILEYTDNPDAANLVRRIRSPKNLGVIGMTSEELSNPAVHAFVSEIKRHFMGDVLDRSFSDGKPVQMPPHVKIQKDIAYLKNIKSRSVGEKIMGYLSEVSIYLNEECSQHCHICPSAFRQFPCCHCSPSLKKAVRMLDMEILERFLDEIGGSSSVSLNLLGGNILVYPHLECLAALLKNRGVPYNLFVHYLNLAEHPNHNASISPLGGSPGFYIVPVSFPVDEDKFRIVCEILRSRHVPFKFLFIIESSDDVNRVETLLLQSRFQGVNSAIRIFYNGHNLDFIEESVFINPSTIEKKRPPLKTIYTNGAVNRSYFGKLTIMPDGGVYAGVKDPCLGRLGKDSVYDMLSKEMSAGKSWLRVRPKMKPCKDCLYNRLCPPLSNYERVMGKNNLCHIYPAG